MKSDDDIVTECMDPVPVAGPSIRAAQAARADQDDRWRALTGLDCPCPAGDDGWAQVHESSCPHASKVGGSRS